MSYIRCLSNPEGLYIYGTHKDLICIHHNVPAPLSSGLNDGQGFFTIPELHFTKAIKYWKQGRKYCKGGFLVEEEHIYLDTGMMVPERTIENMIAEKRPTSYRIRLQYRSDFVYLWRVTWEYVVRNR